MRDLITAGPNRDYVCFTPLPHTVSETSTQQRGGNDSLNNRPLIDSDAGCDERKDARNSIAAGATCPSMCVHLCGSLWLVCLRSLQTREHGDKQRTDDAQSLSRLCAIIPPYPVLFYSAV